MSFAGLIGRGLLSAALVLAAHVALRNRRRCRNRSRATAGTVACDSADRRKFYSRIYSLPCRACSFSPTARPSRTRCRSPPRRKFCRASMLRNLTRARHCRPLSRKISCCRRRRAGRSSRRGARQHHSPHRLAVGSVDAHHHLGAALFLAAAAAGTLRGPGRPVPRTVLLGFVLHDAGVGGKRPARFGRAHGARLCLPDRHVRPRAERHAHATT